MGKAKLIGTGQYSWNPEQVAMRNMHKVKCNTGKVEKLEDLVMMMAMKKGWRIRKIR